MCKINKPNFATRKIRLNLAQKELMKRLLIYAFLILPLFCHAQDDMYFTSSKKAKKEAREAAADLRANAEDVERAAAELEERVAIVTYNSNSRNEDEYNRRYVDGDDYQISGGYPSDSLSANIDSVDAADESSVYEMDDPELDYRFSRRIVRFHNPRAYALASPYYWDLYYVYGAWDYLYDPYDPWYWHYGWRYGWSWGPWDCWYGCIWGWHRPYAWTYWGWGPSWSRPIYGIVHQRNAVPRELNSSRGHMSASRRIRTSATGGTIFGARTSAASRSSSTASRSSARGSRTNTQNVRGGSSYTDYANSRAGRTSATTNRVQQQSDRSNSRRTSAAQRSTATRNNSVTSSSVRTNSSQRSTSSDSRTYNSSSSRSTTRNSTPAFNSTPSRSSVGGGSSIGGANRVGGSVVGGGSRGGGGRR